MTEQTVDGQATTSENAPTSGDGWQALSEAVQARRRELMLSQAEVAARSGISDTTVRSIEAVRRTGYSLRTLRGLAVALGWTPTSIDRILAGEEPELATPAESVEADEPDRELRTEVEHLRREVAQLREIVESLTNPH